MIPSRYGGKMLLIQVIAARARLMDLLGPPDTVRTGSPWAHDTNRR